MPNILLYNCHYEISIIDIIMKENYFIVLCICVGVWNMILNVCYEHDQCKCVGFEIHVTPSFDLHVNLL